MRAKGGSRDKERSYLINFCKEELTRRTLKEQTSQ